MHQPKNLRLLIRSQQSAMFAVGIALALTLAGCDSCGDDPAEGADAGIEGISADAGADGAVAEVGEIPLTPQNLNPIIQEVGLSEIVPESVKIGFALDVINDAPRSASDATSVVIKPETEGTLRFLRNSSLEFTPAGYFRPSTTYSVSVDSVETTDGKMVPDKPWTHSFETPEFKFRGLSGAIVDPREQEVQLDVVFTAPVDADKVGDFIQWTVSDTIVTDLTYKLTNVVYEKGYGDHVVKVTIKDKALEEGGKLVAEISEGIQFKGDEAIVAPAATGGTVLKEGPTVELYGAGPTEGSQGFYIEVACKDEGAPGGTRRRRIRSIGQRYSVSRRCLPTPASVKEHFSIQPKVDFQVASGRAGFNIIGDFKRGTYKLVVDAGMRTIDDGLLSEGFEAELEVPSRSPDLEFVDSGRYIPRSQWNQVALKHLNTPEVEVEVRHIPEENVVFWLNLYNEDAAASVANVIAKERVELKSEPDEQTSSLLDVANFIGEPLPGVYEVNVRSKGTSDTLRLLVTDMNIIAKRSAKKPEAAWSQEFFVWSVDMKDGSPISNVKMDLIRPSGQVMATCNTDGQGGCRLVPDPKAIDPNGPMALIARKGEDFTYLKFSELRTDTSASDTSGEPFLDDVAYRAAIYADRDLYRPAETAHLAAVIRDQNHRAPKQGVPVEITIVDPRNQELRKVIRKTNNAGVVTYDETFTDFAPTGVYTLRMQIGKRQIGTYRFNVEEFVPERMKVVARTNQKDNSMDEQVRIDVEAEYLFGASAEGSSVELTCRIEPADFKPEKNSEYRYGLATSRTSSAVDLGVENSELGEGGTLGMLCPTLEEGIDIVTGRLTATAAVFEAGSGRTTTDTASAMVHAEPFYIGLKSNKKSLDAGEDFSVEGIVVDWDGELYDGVDEVEVQFIRLDREYYWYRSADDLENAWGRNIRPVVESSKKYKVQNGKFRLTGSPTMRPQAYVVRVKAGNTTTDYRFSGSSYYGYWYRSSNRSDDTPRPDKPTELAIETPEAIEVGKQADFSIEVPFKGKLLVTAETHRVLTHEWHDVEPGKFDWRFILGSFAPNIYVSALLVKDPHIESEEAYMPDRAFGVESVKVTPVEQTHQVRLKVPDVVEPNSELAVDVEVEGVDGTDTFVTVSAVDEGILSITDFETPVPNDSLFSRRALGVDTFETIGWALQGKAAGPTGATGGGGEYEEEPEGAGMDRPMPIKPVALWSGLVKVDPKTGKARVKFDVPRYRGKLRVVAHASSASKTGVAETHVTVRDPLVLQTTLPRFLSANDKIQIPVFVTNMTGKAGTVSVSLTSSARPLPGLVDFGKTAPMVEFTGPATKTIALEKNESGTVVFEVRGLRQAGVAEFKVEATLGNTVSYDDGIVPFRPNGPEERRVQKIELTSGMTELSTYLTGWVPTSEDTTVWVTSNPYGESFEHLKYLIRYPYGCLEQTTSSTRPMLFVADLVELVAPEIVEKEGRISKMVQAGIERIFSMQTSSGGFGYWPGATSPHAWGTAYATHMLVDAKKAGFDVPEDRLERAIAWLEREALAIERGARSGASHYGNGEPYAHYVLALSGRGKKARILRLIQDAGEASSGKDIENLYMLKAALYLAGDRRYEKDLKNVGDMKNFSSPRDSRYSYYSDRRMRAFVLSTFHDLFGTSADGERLAKTVAEGLTEKRRSHYYTTQELVWGITGLGKWIEGMDGGFSSAALTLNGKSVQPQAKPKKSNDRTWAVHRASEYDSVKLELDGLEGTVWAMISSKGVRKKPEVRYGGEGLQITREFLDFKGRKIEPTGHNLGDLVYTQITVKNTSKKTLYNLAMVDRFAGGWEVENPRLGRGTLPDWVDTAKIWNPEHMNIRDDRIEVFGSLRRDEEVTFVYAVRSVSAGAFFAPPPEIAGMYEPEIWARAQPAKVTIGGPWEDYLN